MVEILLPDSTVSFGTGWTLTGAATAHQAVDEGVAGSDDGTTQVWNRDGAPLPVAWFEVGLSNPSAPPGSNSGHWLRCRFRMTLGTWPLIPGQVSLYQGATLIKAFDLPSPGANVWTTFAVELLSATAALITDYSNLSIRVSEGSVGTYIFRVSAVELEVPDPASEFEVSPGAVRFEAQAPTLALQADLRVAPVALRLAARAPRLAQPLPPFEVPATICTPFAAGGRTAQALDFPQALAAPQVGGRAAGSLEVPGAIAAGLATARAAQGLVVPGVIAGVDAGGRTRTTATVELGGPVLDAGGRTRENLNL